MVSPLAALQQLAGQLEAALGEAADLLVEVAAELCDTDAASDADSNSGSFAVAAMTRNFARTC